MLLLFNILTIPHVDLCKCCVVALFVSKPDAKSRPQCPVTDVQTKPKPYILISNAIFFKAIVNKKTLSLFCFLL